MLRILIAASAVALAATPALAQQGPRLVGSGDNAVVEYGDQAPGSVVGGGVVQMTGTGANTAFTYGPVAAQPGRVARLSGSGVNAEVTYAPAEPTSRTLAGMRGARSGG